MMIFRTFLPGLGGIYVSLIHSLGRVATPYSRRRGSRNQEWLDKVLSTQPGHKILSSAKDTLSPERYIKHTRGKVRDVNKRDGGCCSGKMGDR